MIVVRPSLRCNGITGAKNCTMESGVRQPTLDMINVGGWMIGCQGKILRNEVCFNVPQTCFEDTNVVIKCYIQKNDVNWITNTSISLDSARLNRGNGTIAKCNFYFSVNAYVSHYFPCDRHQNWAFKAIFFGVLYNKPISNFCNSDIENVFHRLGHIFGCWTTCINLSPFVDVMYLHRG